jgi:hypothetical protein
MGQSSERSFRINLASSMDEASKLNEQPRRTFTDSADWATLYRIAAWCCLVVVGFIIVQIAVFFTSPPPATVIGWYDLFHGNWLVGLLDMDLLLTVDYVLLAVVYLALYAALRRASRSLMAIAIILALLSTAAYFASTAFNMLSLSNQYWAAVTEIERTQLLAAGQATMAIWTGTAFDLSYVLDAVAILLISITMLRSDVFSRWTGYAGLAMAVTMSVPPTAGTFGIVLSLLSLAPTVVWLVLIAQRFAALAQRAA